MILDPFMTHRLCKVPETHTGNHYFSQHLISLTILTIDYHRRFTASFGVGRVLRPVATVYVSIAVYITNYQDS